MTIKLVQGLVDRAGTAQQPDPAAATAQKASSALQTSILTTQVATGVHSTEAAVTALRGVRTQGVIEKLRDPERADSVAKDLAERLREGEDDKAEAHDGLEYIVARDHLT